MSVTVKIGIVLWSTVCGWGWSADNPPANPGTPARLVNLNVVALDSHNDPVTDLAASDFEIVDANKPQTIVFFRHNQMALQPSAALAPNEFSNRTESAPRATVILFDLLNEAMDARGNTWNSLVHLLEQEESGRSLYLYLLTVDGRLFPVHPLPTSESESAAGRADGWTRQIKPLLDAAMHAVYRVRPVEIDIDTRVRITYTMLANLAAQMAWIPGRKNIVWITHGIPIDIGPARSYTGDWIDYTPLVHRLTATLDWANAAIYPVQAVPPGMAMAGTPEARTSGLGSEDTLQQLAGLTGGRYFSEDIAAGIRQARNDMRTSYQIAYQPPLPNWDAKYHKLRVSCRRKGVKLQTKVGYYAWADPPADEQSAFEAAAAAPFDAAEIGLRAAVSSDAKDPHMARFDVIVDAADVLLLDKGKEYAGNLRFAAVAYFENGQKQSTRIDSLDLRMNPDEYAKAMNGGIRIPQDIQLGDKKVDKVRLIVFDAGLNAIGWLTVPVKTSGQ
jgi:VWFA-related protein